MRRIRQTFNARRLDARTRIAMPTNHPDPLRTHLSALPKVAPPKPWRRSTIMAVGGLRAIGFDRDSELLLIVSASGRGVVDCRSGERIARDAEDYWEDEQFLEAAGIGPLAGKTLRVAGLTGGGLSLCTADGWSIELATLDWPATEILLLEPGADLYTPLTDKPLAVHKLHTELALRACGFSYSGESFAVATSSDVAIYTRYAG